MNWQRRPGDRPPRWVVVVNVTLVGFAALFMAMAADNCARAAVMRLLP